MLAFRLTSHLRWHRWMNNLPRHSNTWYCSVLYEYNHQISLEVIFLLIANKKEVNWKNIFNSLFFSTLISARVCIHTTRRVLRTQQFPYFISRSLLRHCKNKDTVGKLVTLPKVKKISDICIAWRLLQTHKNVVTGRYPNPEVFSSQAYTQFLKKRFGVILSFMPVFYKFSR